MIARLDRRLFLGAGAGLLLTGCSGASAGDAPATPVTSSAPVAESSWVTPRELPAGWGSGRDDGVFPRTVVHAAGSTTVPARPTRVVVISTGQMDAALTLGVVPVGATAGDGAGRVPGYLRDRFPADAAALDAVADLGTRTEPNLEAVAALAPDLVLVNASAKDGDVLAALQAIAPTVVTQGTGLRWKQDLLLLADGLGLRQRAQSWLDEQHGRAAALAPDPSPTVSFLRRNGDRVRVFGVASFSGSVAEDAGLARPPAQSFTDDTSRDLSAEQLDLADADHLLFGVQGGDAAELTSLPTWGDLGAVRAGRAVQVDDDAFFLNTGPTAARIVLEELERVVG
ncbi:ABC transporter substrate-binding protein [Kineococcus sp. NPDC059986]|uniref:ABC transporter substrate-binding protein n=1 Tax=Kineococcus sp. NPDC059986 TaxID=3155538 RepID=UPI00344B7B87